VLIVLGVLKCASSASAENAVAVARGGAGAIVEAVPGEQPLLPPLAQNQRGRELFVRHWTADDSHSPKGDGLGPMFNAQSCADCHNLGGLGGGGKNKNNVDLLSVVLPANREKIDRAKFHDRMTHFHPAFTEGTSSVRPFITLHKFGNDPAYAPWRLKLLAQVLPNDVELSPPATSKRPQPNHSTANHAGSLTRASALAISQHTGSPMRVDFERTQRNTPALFGAGLIDSIPDDAIREAADDEARHHVVKGKVALAGSGGVGKFGWRGQTATLKEFVMGACANELGLQVPGQNQPLDPLDPTHQSPGLDLTQEQCDDLTSYVASLPAPKQKIPADAKTKQQVQEGGLLFKLSGCAACHMESLGKVTGIYSDLLLHDMGPDLADPVPASEQVATIVRMPVQSAARSFGGGYFGGSSDPASEPDVFVDPPPLARRQWRTPPLWGVADSGPYLHDGRAATLQDAIMAHGGEATSARQEFAMLPSTGRVKILAFLKTLTAN
jgi:CxxC motif-containing protein (DUF1111 family)